MRLPPEITDRVIDELSYEHQTLSSCTLVSRNFLPRSRLHFFRHVILSTPQSCKRFHELILSNPSIASLVKSLEIDTDPRYKCKEDIHLHELIERALFQSSSDRQWVCRDPILQDILYLLPNVTSLTTGAMRWRNFSRIPTALSFERALSSIASGITTLRLDYVHFDCLTDLLDMLSAFTRLKSLCLGTIIAAPFAATDAERVSLGIEELEMDMEGSSRVVEMFLLRAKLEKLRRLRVTKYFSVQVELVRALMDLTKDSLEDLEMGTCILPADWAKRCPPLDVSYLKSLWIEPPSCSLAQWWALSLENADAKNINLVVKDFDTSPTLGSST
ncbi:uncharacterized protein EV420DRAFT_887522 [Desarmillaria tabescens]|uniref:F-box domain-containing protein n=1 Tax=Armillaria tabescens TaxID=1929756 RepID=A0AA39JQG7_ARMTA|nr:uncharacterized protein EV420DRAFT_887522 [Desarmillaria tabescens]KAK0447040.1 hypothetical protein EV420DRAFT_887522 [Desarmillaria tabescens]